LRYRPNNQDAYNDRGVAYGKELQYDHAISDYTQAIHLDQKLDIAYLNRSFVYLHEGLCDRAIADDQQALNLQPEDPNGYNALAWVLATCPRAEFRNGGEAVASAKKACQLSLNPEFIDTLAAAFAEAGDFDAAIAAEQQALSHTNVDEFRERLRLYQQHEPYRVNMEIGRRRSS